MDKAEKYYQLVKTGQNSEERHIGFKRVVTEYLDTAVMLKDQKWTKEPLEYDDAYFISEPPPNIENLPRKRTHRGCHYESSKR